MSSLQMAMLLSIVLSSAYIARTSSAQETSAGQSAIANVENKNSKLSDDWVKPEKTDTAFDLANKIDRLNDEKRTVDSKLADWDSYSNFVEETLDSYEKPRDMSVPRDSLSKHATKIKNLSTQILSKGGDRIEENVLDKVMEHLDEAQRLVRRSIVSGSRLRSGEFRGFSQPLSSFGQSTYSDREVSRRLRLLQEKLKNIWPTATAEETCESLNVDENSTPSHVSSFLTSCASQIEGLVGQLEKGFDVAKAELVSERNFITNRISIFQKQKENVDRNRSTLVRAFSAKTNIQESLINVGLPLMVGLIVSMLMLPRIFHTDVQKLVFGNNLILEVMTVFLLTIVILLLGIGERIESNVLGTLLGGISGYVLGRSIAQGNRQPSSEVKT